MPRRETRQVLSYGLLALSGAVPTVAATIAEKDSVVLISSAVAGLLLTTLGQYALEKVPGRIDTLREQFFMNRHIKPALESLANVDETARMNVMRLTGVARKRFEFHSKYNFNGCADAGMWLRVGHGVAGYAYKAKKWARGDCETGEVLVDGKVVANGDPCRHMPQDQRDLVKSARLKLIYSYPVMRQVKDKSGAEFVNTNRVIGVVNVDSQRPRARAFYEEDREGGSLHSRLVEQVLPVAAIVAGVILS